jgi:cell division protein FtsB
MLRRVLISAAALVVLVFVVEGGEFGTWDLMRQRARKAELTVAIDSLEREIDSLRQRKVQVESDPATQERIAREQYGYVRGEKEILYRFVDPRRDTAAARAEP